MKKIVIAPDSYKGSLSAKEVGLVIARAFQEVFPNITTTVVPLADGGEGTTETLNDALGGEWTTLNVKNPLGNVHSARYAYVEDRGLAIIEMAEASGLNLVPTDERNPLVTSTYGTGELIKHALERGATEFIIGLGGSATNDAGMGMMRALGVAFLDKAGNPIPCGGGALARLDKIDLTDLHPKLAEATFHVACDVTNPLVGEQGASAVFAPQKGATPAMVSELDEALTHYSSIVHSQLGVNVAHIPGGGAAGGMGSAFCTFFPKAELKSGISIVVDAVKLDEHVADADLVITGEGCMDYQTQFGKTPMGAQQVAQTHGVPIIGIAGSLGEGYESLLQKGFQALFDTTVRPCNLHDAIKLTEQNLFNTSLSVARLMKLG